jgi:hypothetical protein
VIILKSNYCKQKFLAKKEERIQMVLSARIWMVPTTPATSFEAAGRSCLHSQLGAIYALQGKQDPNTSQTLGHIGDIL